MQYCVISAMNNNVVLVKDADGEQVVLMSKGIGFGRKAGDFVSDEAKDRQIFKLWTDGHPIHPIKDDRGAIRQAVAEIVRLARKRLSAMPEGLYDALLDHIQFAVDRLHFGLPIENPFVRETALLYPSAFQVAQEAVKIIKTKVGIQMGEAEAGFIALHLHSAAADDGMDRSMRSVQLYRDIMQALGDAGTETDRRVFLQGVFELIEMIRRGVKLRFPFTQKELEPLKDSAELAGCIRSLVEKSCSITFDENAMCFLTLEAEKLRQSSDSDSA